MNYTSLVFNSKFSTIKKLNDEFTLAYCYVCATGKNRNGSNIDKSTIEKALPSLWNIPVVAHVYTDENGEKQVGGHDYTIEKGDDGVYRYKSLCVPFGVVPEKPDEYSFEEVEEPNGRGTKTYLKVPVVLWTSRYPEITEAYLDSDKMYSQSMEINVSEYSPLSDDPNYTNITDFSFSALTLLGKDVEPCFPEAKLVDASFSLDADGFTAMFEQFKSELASCFANSEKGEKMEEEKTPEQVVEEPVALEEPATENEFSACSAEEDVVADEPKEGKEEALFSATYQEKRTAIKSLLQDQIIRNNEGEVVKEVCWYLMDFDDNYAFVEKCEYAADAYSCNHYRFKYSFDKDSLSAAIVGEFEEVFLKWLTKDEISAIEEKDSQFAALQEYKAMREKEDHQHEIDSAIAEFSFMEGNEEYNAIFEKRYSYENVEDIKNACYIVKGKYSIVNPQKKTISEPSVPVAGFRKTEKTPRERLHELYGKH